MNELVKDKDVDQVIMDKNGILFKDEPKLVYENIKSIYDVVGEAYEKTQKSCKNGEYIRFVIVYDTLF